MAKTVDNRPSKVDDLRAILDPGGYQLAAKQGIVQLKAQLASLFFDLDLARESPEIPEEQRQIVLARMEALIRDAAWRIKRAEKMLVEATGDPRRDGAGD